MFSLNNRTRVVKLEMIKYVPAEHFNDTTVDNDNDNDNDMQWSNNHALLYYFYGSYYIFVVPCA